MIEYQRRTLEQCYAWSSPQAVDYRVAVYNSTKEVERTVNEAVRIYQELLAPAKARAVALMKEHPDPLMQSIGDALERNDYSLLKR